jgi:hypothetical protein
MQRVGLMIKHNYLQFSFQQSITFAPFFLCPFLPLPLSSFVPFSGYIAFNFQPGFDMLFRVIENPQIFVIFSVER